MTLVIGAEPPRHPAFAGCEDKPLRVIKMHSNTRTAANRKAIRSTCVIHRGHGAAGQSLRE